MSKQLKKLSYEPETITINVVGAITTDSGTLTISQIKVLLENAKNTITYQTSANYSEVLHLAQADYENSTAPKATYTADYYDSSTNVYYKHIIVVSYNTLFNSATWVFVSAPMVSGSSSDLQEKLVSGTNIKTINGNNVLGSGNLAISEFPERSEVDAALTQIAGLNSQGNPDVGKVAAGNISSTGATNGQVLTADGSGGCAWANAGGGGYKYTYDLVIITPFYVPFGGGPDSTKLHYIFKSNASASAIETGLLQTINSVLGTSFTEFTTILENLQQMGSSNEQIFSQLMQLLALDNFPTAANISNLGFEFINSYLEVNEWDGHANILAVYDNTAVIWGQIFENNAMNYRIIDLYEEIKGTSGDYGNMYIEVV